MYSLSLLLLLYSIICTFISTNNNLFSSLISIITFVCLIFFSIAFVGSNSASNLTIILVPESTAQQIGLNDDIMLATCHFSSLLIIFVALSCSSIFELLSVHFMES